MCFLFLRIDVRYYIPPTHRKYPHTHPSLSTLHHSIWDGQEGLAICDDMMRCHGRQKMQSSSPGTWRCQTNPKRSRMDSWINSWIHGTFFDVGFCRNKSKDIKQINQSEKQKCPREPKASTSQEPVLVKHPDSYSRLAYQTSVTWWCKMNYSCTPNPSTHNFLNDGACSGGTPPSILNHPEAIFFCNWSLLMFYSKWRLNTHQLEKTNHSKLTPKDVALTSSI